MNNISIVDIITYLLGVGFILGLVIGFFILHKLKRNNNIKSGGILNYMDKYFQIGTPEWQITVKWCLRIGVIIGLICGLSILLKVL